MININDKLTFTIKVETKDRGDSLLILELAAYLSQKDQNKFKVKIISDVDLSIFFKDNFESQIITKLSTFREIILDLKVALIEIDLELEKIFSKEFGNNYNIKVISNEKWLNADGLSLARDSKFEKVEKYKVFSGAEMGDIENAKEVDERFDPFVKVQVLYATDRLKTKDTKPNSVFGADRSQTGLDLGICEVSMPKDHEMGKIERPSWWKSLKLKNPENPEKHISILNLQSKTASEFSLLLNKRIQHSAENDAFIFIHGYNVSFKEAIQRTAQVTFDLGFAGAAITYSWPSQSTLKGYFADEDAAVWTVPHLKYFIKLVLSDNKLKRLHLIAHSMGNRALTNALKELCQENVDMSRINQVVLAAPDIDVQVFRDVLLPNIKGIGKQITLYASSKDKALQTSRTIRSNITRAGESGADILMAEGVDTVDASQVDTDLLGHGYFAQTKELLTDLHMTINLCLKPKQRMLRNIQKSPSGMYWQFPI